MTNYQNETTCQFPLADKHEFIQNHLIGYIGQLVTALGEAELLEVPDGFIDEEGDERTIFSWYQVDEVMSRRLLYAGECVLEFEELYLWGRTSWGLSITSDDDLMKRLKLISKEDRV